LLFFSKDDNSLELKKESGIWYVLQGDKKEKADSNAITSILKVLADIKIQNVVGRTKDKWNDLQLTDSIATRVSIFNADNQIIKDIFIGKFTYRQRANFSGYGGVSGLTYVRLSDMPESFIVNGFLPMSFNRDFNSFRNSTIVALQKDAVNKIEFNYPADTSFVLAKADSALWKINSVDTADFNKVNHYLSTMTMFRDMHFDDTFKPVNDAVFTLKFYGKKMQPITVWVYQKDSVNFAVGSTQTSAYFTSNRKGMLSRLLKTKQDFVK